MQKKKNKFITFEGLDGCGKSTQAKLLYDFLLSKSEKVLLLHEPGSTPIGEQIRQIIIDKKNNTMSYKTEVLLFMASRAQLISEKIIPALQDGFMIICDRFIDSSIAYQGIGRGLDIDLVENLNQFVTENIKPDLTFFLDITPEEALKRKKELETKKNKDRIESEDLFFYKKVCEAYKKISDKDITRIVTLNAMVESKILHREIINVLSKR